MASDHKDPDSQSTSHEDDRSDDHGAADSTAKVEEHPDSDVPTIVVSDDAGSHKTDSEVDGSTSLGSHHSESDVEVVTVWKTS